jgi:hypothetical protein
MISEKLIIEFQEIAKTKYGLDLSFKEASEIGDDLVGFFDTLAKMDFEKRYNRTLSK